LFFRNAKNWSELPALLDTPELRQAMTMLQWFSEKEKAYHLYQARENAIREEKTQQALLEEALEQKEQALQREEKATKEQARLRELLKKAGISPDSE